ncbi:MAG: DUF3786 domain-containing protein [Bacillota bacterium]|jgi:hypothetical protein|nr:DUF3786 domain-containing protein [Clostridia bacterium]
MAGRHQYQDAFDYSLHAFRSKKPEIMADLADVTWEEPLFKFNYLNIPICLNWQTGEILPNNLSTEEKIIIYQYLSESSGISRDCNRWISFLELPEGQHHYQPFIKEAIEPIAHKFGTNPALFLRAGEKLGGLRVQGGDASFKFQVFPKIALMVMLWEEDDEFPARSNILFDSRSGCHLATATLYMLGIEVSKRLLAI